MPDYLPVTGEIVEPGGLRMRRARELAAFLAAEPVHASLVETRVAGDYDVVVLDVEVQRPQRMVHAIARVERLAVHFDARADVLPAVHALREDFPLVPHLNQTPVEKPRSLCLYEEPWTLARLSWTAGRFVRRLRTWLADTALDRLHRDDQVLEPLIMPTATTLVLPAGTDFAALGATARIHRVTRLGPQTILAWPTDATPAEEEVAHLLFGVATRTTAHGIIRRTPHSLKELHELLADFGVNLAEALAERLREWKTAQENNPILKRRPILLVALPKSRAQDGAQETTEYHAFFSDQPIEEIGIALDLFDRAGAKGPVGVLVNQPLSIDALAEVKILPMQVQTGLTREGAARQNGVPVFDEAVLGIGLGALGSQIFHDLVCSGFGRWTVVDSDTFAPHNGARHWALPCYTTGSNKAELAARMGEGFEWDVVTEAIDKDALELSAEEVNKHALVADFSASVPVSRFLSHCPGLTTRCVSAFITPGGGGLAVAAEDRGRRIRLDWLEMLHYRQVLHHDAARGTMVAAERNRYGNACRDISTVLAQDDVALWASTASRALKRRVVTNDGAVLMIWKRDAETGAVAHGAITPARCQRFQLREWTVVLDDWLREKLAAFREAKLPNETGGILVGHFDVLHAMCYLVDALPSPRDSVEWPEAYYRGCNGLRAAVTDIERQTLGQLSYVGEWHSHPRGCSILPSRDDMTAYEWLAENMNADSYPAIMLIVGDASSIGIVTAEPPAT